MAERRQTGWKRKRLQLLSMRGEDQGLCSSRGWSSICAISEATGTLWELLGEVIASGKRPDRQTLTVLSGLEIERPVIAGINVL